MQSTVVGTGINACRRRLVGITLNTISGSITLKEGLRVTLYILEHLLVEASTNNDITQN